MPSSERGKKPSVGSVRQNMVITSFPKGKYRHPTKSAEDENTTQSQLPAMVEELLGRPARRVLQKEGKKSKKKCEKSAAKESKGGNLKVQLNAKAISPPNAAAPRKPLGVLTPRTAPFDAAAPVPPTAPLPQSLSSVAVVEVAEATDAPAPAPFQKLRGNTSVPPVTCELNLGPPNTLSGVTDAAGITTDILRMSDSMTAATAPTSSPYKHQSRKQPMARKKSSAKMAFKSPKPRLPIVDMHHLSPNTATQTLASGYMFRFKRERQLTRDNKQLRGRVDELSDELLRLTAQKNKTFKVQNAVRQAHAAEKATLKAQLSEAREKQAAENAALSEAKQKHAAEKAALLQQLAESEQQVEDLLMTASPLQESAETQTEPELAQPTAVQESIETQTEPELAPPALVSTECQTEDDAAAVEADCAGITFAKTPLKEGGVLDDGAGNDHEDEEGDEDDAAFAPSAIAAAAAAAASASTAVLQTPEYPDGIDAAPSTPLIQNLSDLAAAEDAIATGSRTTSNRRGDTTFNASTIGDWVDMNDVTTFAGDLNKTSIRSMYTQCMADISTARKVDDLRGVGRLIRALIKRRLFSKDDFASLQNEYKQKMMELRTPGYTGTFVFEDVVDAADTEDTRRLKVVITTVKAELIKAKSTVARQSWQTEKLKLYCKERDKFILDLLQSPEKLQGRQTLLNQFLNRPSLSFETGGSAAEVPHFQPPPTPGGALGASPNTPYAVVRRGERNAALVDMVTQQDNADESLDFGGDVGLTTFETQRSDPAGGSGHAIRVSSSNISYELSSTGRAVLAGEKGPQRMQMLQLTTTSKTETIPVSAAVARKMEFPEMLNAGSVEIAESPQIALQGWSPGMLAYATPVTVGTPAIFSQPTPIGFPASAEENRQGDADGAGVIAEAEAEAEAGGYAADSAGGAGDKVDLNTSVKYNAVPRVDAPMSLSHCGSCMERVYVVERLVVDNIAYHKGCFKCSHCKKVISAGTYASLNGRLFCKPHFQQFFKRAGNYDGGSFGMCSPARFKPLDQSILEHSLLESSMLEQSFVAVPPTEDVGDLSAIEGHNGEHNGEEEEGEGAAPNHYQQQHHHHHQQQEKDAEDKACRPPTFKI